MVLHQALFSKVKNVLFFCCCRYVVHSDLIHMTAFWTRELRSLIAARLWYRCSRCLLVNIVGKEAELHDLLSSCTFFQQGWRHYFRVLATGDMTKGNAPSPLFSSTLYFHLFIVFLICPLLSSGCPEVLHAKLFSVVIDCECVALFVLYSWLFVHSA